jgi:hypothetical protein|tara:strand:- start:3142 stop:3711 length:570 start_codon:yes stop_codon:yes gene_type:complete
MASNSVTVLDVIRGLSQAAANAYDGTHIESFSPDGEVRTAGLKREEGNPLIDRRVMDGFNIRFMGPYLCVSYQTELQLKEVYAKNFESNMEQRVADIVKFLKEEYKKITGKSVSLTEEGEIDVLVQSTSRVHSWATAYQKYKIGGIGEAVVVEGGSEDTLQASWKTFLDQGGWKGKRPDNDTRKKESEK